MTPRRKKKPTNIDITTLTFPVLLDYLLSLSTPPFHVVGQPFIELDKVLHLPPSLLFLYKHIISLKHRITFIGHSTRYRHLPKSRHIIQFIPNLVPMLEIIEYSI